MPIEIKIVDREPVPILSLRERVQNPQIQSKMGEMFGQLWMFMERKNIQVVGPPFAVYHDYDADSCDMECGFPTERQETGEGNIRSSSVPGGKCVFATHVGPYESIMGTYELIKEFIRKEGLEPKKVMFERYLNDPATVKDPDQLVTEIYWPID
jgi:effector-binding domain-containing protein